MSYQTGIRLFCVAQNPANGFPARLLEQLEAAAALTGRPLQHLVSAPNGAFATDAHGPGLLKQLSKILEVWPESHLPGFALRKTDVFQSDMT